MFSNLINLERLDDFKRLQDMVYYQAFLTADEYVDENGLIKADKLSLNITLATAADIEALFDQD